MRGKLKNTAQSRWFIGIACLLLGALVVLGIRFATYQHDGVHYHANFAVYIDGQREMFKDKMYYQEVNMCAANEDIVPATRAHMHDYANDVVHVEDHAVTWGQFFSNLGWTLGPDFIQTAHGTMHMAGGDKQLHLMLNGQDYTGLGGLSNYVIKDTDKLLVSFGDVSDSDLQKQYDAMPSTAHKYDTLKDPASCAGSHDATMRERMQHLL